MALNISVRATTQNQGVKTVKRTSVHLELQIILAQITCSLNKLIATSIKAEQKQEPETSSEKISFRALHVPCVTEATMDERAQKHLSMERVLSCLTNRASLNIFKIELNSGR